MAEYCFAECICRVCDGGGSDRSDHRLQLRLPRTGRLDPLKSDDCRCGPDGLGLLANDRHSHPESAHFRRDSLLVSGLGSRARSGAGGAGVALFGSGIVIGFSTGEAANDAEFGRDDRPRSRAKHPLD